MVIELNLVFQFRGHLRLWFLIGMSASELEFGAEFVWLETKVAQLLAVVLNLLEFFIWYVYIIPWCNSWCFIEEFGSVTTSSQNKFKFVLWVFGWLIKIIIAQVRVWRRSKLKLVWCLVRVVTLMDWILWLREQYKVGIVFIWMLIIIGTEVLVHRDVVIFWWWWQNAVRAVLFLALAVFALRGCFMWGRHEIIMITFLVLIANRLVVVNICVPPPLVPVFIARENADRVGYNRWSVEFTPVIRLWIRLSCMLFEWFTLGGLVREWREGWSRISGGGQWEIVAISKASVLEEHWFALGHNPLNIGMLMAVQFKNFPIFDVLLTLSPKTLAHILYI